MLCAPSIADLLSLDDARFGRCSREARSSGWL
jgi:hypothetical protein